LCSSESGPLIRPVSPSNEPSIIHSYAQCLRTHHAVVQPLYEAGAGTRDPRRRLKDGAHRFKNWAIEPGVCCRSLVVSDHMPLACGQVTSRTASFAIWNPGLRRSFSQKDGGYDMRNFLLILIILLTTATVSAAQNAENPRLDSEGINMDAAPPPSAQPRQPADPLAPNSSDGPKAGPTTGQAPRDERFPADRGEVRPVPSAPK